MALPSCARSSARRRTSCAHMRERIPSSRASGTRLSPSCAARQALRTAPPPRPSRATSSSACSPSTSLTAILSPSPSATASSTRPILPSTRPPTAMSATSTASPASGCATRHDRPGNKMISACSMRWQESFFVMRMPHFLIHLGGEKRRAYLGSLRESCYNRRHNRQ